MSALADDAIGGYFSLESGDGNGLPLLKSAIGYQSARSAMAAALIDANPETVWVPYFICGVVNDMLHSIGINVQHYSLTENFGVPSDLELGAFDLLICADYFGMCGSKVNTAIERYGVQRVLVDASQSLYFPPCAESTVVFSPRKFVGVPDGGLLFSPREPPSLLPADETGSQFRSRHLRTRASGQVQAGYLEFQEAEKSLIGCRPHAMSIMTKTLLGTIDFDGIAVRRRANYNVLAAELSANGFHTMALPPSAVPLCFPIMDVNADILRLKLASQHIFTPAYWPDASIPACDRIGTLLRDRTLYLPCDQRYGTYEMQKIIKALIELKDCT